MKRTLILTLTFALLWTGTAGARGLKKNTGSQKWVVFAFDRTDNSAKTGDAAQITADVYLDGVVNAVDDANPTELAHGYYVFDLVQAETNADCIVIDAVSATPNIQVVGCPQACWTDEIAAISDIWNALTASYGGAGTYAQAIEDTLANIGTPVALDGGSATLGAMLTKMADDNAGADFDAGTDSLQEIRDRGDAAWTTGGAAAGMVSGTVSAGSTAISFTLSNDFAATANAYPEGTVIGIVDAGDSKEYIGFVKSYTAARVVTLIKPLPIVPANADVAKIYATAINPTVLRR